MLTNTERQQIVEEVNAGTYGIDEALDDIAAAQKGEEVRKALYAEALVLNREGHAGSTDMIARQQIANLQTSVNGQISTLRTEVGDDIDDLETALNSGLATQNGRIAAQDATIANVVASYNVEYGSTELWASTGETGALAAGTTVTLSEDVSHFDYIDIYSFCGNSNVLDTVPVDAKLQSSQGYALRWVNLSDPDSGSYKAYVRIIETRLHIIGTTLTIDHQVTYRNGEEVNISGAEITQSNRSTYMGELGIMKIVGRKITANTEIEDVRIGADGTEYNSAGEAVRAQVQNLDNRIPAVDDTLSVQGAAADAKIVGDEFTNVKEDLSDCLNKSNAGYMSFDASDFIRGQIEKGSDGTYYQDRIKLSAIHNTGDYPKIFSLEDGYAASFAIYDDEGAYQYQSGYVSNYVIDKDTNFRLVVRNNSHTDSDHTTPADMSAMSKVLTFNTVPASEIEAAYKGKLYTTLLDYDMEMGTIDGYGNNDEGAYNKVRKVRTVGYVFVKKGDIITVGNSALRVMVFHYGMNKAYKSNSNWFTTSFEITENEYVRIQFSLSTDSTMPEALKATYRGAISIENNLSDVLADIDSNINDLQTSGRQYSYDGEKIDVNKYSYDITALWNFSNPTTSGSFSKQGSAYSNGVVFKCFNPDLMQLYEFETGGKIAEFAITSGHGDSIDFSNEYYNSSDEFPLCYITADTTPAKVFVNRVTRSGATLIRTLSFPLETTGYYAGHCLDAINNVLYQIGYKNNDYQNADNGNHMIVSKWDLAELTDNGDDTFTPAFLDTFDLPFMNTTQGQVMLNGKIFIMSSNPYVDTGTTEKTKIYVVDVGGQRISNVLSSFIERISDHEGEGVFFVPRENKYDLYVDIHTSGLYKIAF